MSRRSITVAADHPAFAGHFPGAPIWPGVLLLAEVFEALNDDPGLRERLGPLPQLAAAKFLAPVRPGAELQLQLVDKPQAVRFEVHCAGTLVASGEWRARTGAGTSPS